MNPKKDVSIEYAHIYTNDKLGEEQKLSFEILTSLRKEYEQGGQSISLAVMVDDYSFPDPTFNYDIFAAELSAAGLKPNVVVRESQLIPVCDVVLTLIQDANIKDPVVDYVKTKKKYPCSLFIATWYLLRLGHLSSPLFDTSFAGNKLVNILPTSFKPFEDKALELMAATPYPGSVQNVEHRYFEGRLIA